MSVDVGELKKKKKKKKHVAAAWSLCQSIPAERLATCPGAADARLAWRKAAGPRGLSRRALATGNAAGACPIFDAPVFWVERKQHLLLKFFTSVSNRWSPKKR
jgi:hypothetical protein